MKTLFLSFIVLAAFMAPLSFAFAQEKSNTTFDTFSNTSYDASSNTSCGSSNGVFKLCDPLGNKNFCQLVKTLLDIIIAIGVPVAVLFLVWSGFRFIFARGNSTELATARTNFMYVIIGIAVFLGAWTLASIISTTIQSLDTSGSIQFCGK